MDEDEFYSMEVLNMWRVPELKDYLKKRGLKTSKKAKIELVALAYSAERCRVEMVPTPQEEKIERQMTYQSLLKTDEGSLPDPNSLKEWQNERDSMQIWPPVIQMDIADYLLRGSDKNLARRLMSDYKEGKAYSYFDSKWLGELFYHPINDTSKFCFMKCICRPSQKISAAPHNVWILFEKVSGRITSAYCTCFAGLGSTCNHIAAALFKVEFALKMGLSASSKTSRLCSWDNFGGTKTIVPKKMKEVDLRKPHHCKQGAKTVINPRKRQLFEPIPTMSTKKLEDDPLIHLLYKDNPNGAIFQYINFEEGHVQNYTPEADFNVELEIEVETQEAIPPSIFNISENCQSADDLKEKLFSFTTSQTNKLEEETRTQSESDLWKKQRWGRITASNVHRVYTFMKRFDDSNINRDATSLLDTLCSTKDKDLSNIKAIKYGRLNEPIAREKYITYLKESGHTNVRVEPAGLFVSPNDIYMGASPDGIVLCDCCGKGLLEIKCPFSIANEDPCSASIPYLVEGNDGRTLKENHQYYSQIMFQMGIVGCTWADFFIFSHAGFFVKRIPLNKKRFDELCDSARKFFSHRLADYIVKNRA